MAWTATWLRPQVGEAGEDVSAPLAPRLATASSTCPSAIWYGAEVTPAVAVEHQDVAVTVADEQVELAVAVAVGDR